jgi:asparagine synthase (glutamine-hydrolysing)
MSVQAGILDFDGRPIDPGLVTELSKSLELQGPDSEKFYIDGSAGLLYRAFHTTGESWHENQPCFSRRGSVLLWDGRLDNREELIDILGTDLPPGPTDVAIVAAAYDRWQDGTFARLVGDWAVSLWKPEDREVVLAVDYLSVRHIFYMIRNNRITWATDINPLVLLSGERFRINDEYIAGYLAHDPDGHLTPYCDIQQVPPGHFVRVKSGKASKYRHWSLTRRSSIRYNSDCEYEQHFLQLFRQSVRRRLRADTPVLAELSGGVDSSSIVCMADDILAKEGAQASALDTLSCYDTTEPDGDDSVYFPKIEEQRGKVGFHIDCGKAQCRTASYQISKFVGFPGPLGNRRELEVERAAIIRGGNYRVVLSGIGGDEFMGAIPDPRSQLADLIVCLKAVDLIKQLWAWALVKRQPMISLLWQSTMILLPTAMRQFLGNTPKTEPWIETDFSRRTGLGARLIGGCERLGFGLPTRRSYIGGLLLMANSMAKRTPPELAVEELRYPYLDQNLIEFILAIPADQMLRPGERRSLMRRALRDLVPAEILERRTKQVGARTPAITLDRNLAELRTLFISPLSSRFGYIDPVALLTTIEEGRHGKPVNLIRLRKAIALEVWLQGLSVRELLQYADEAGN